MKLLLDENLSPKLIDRLADLYPGSVHVRDVGLAAALDLKVWQYAGEQHFVIVSKDADFNDISTHRGHPQSKSGFDSATAAPRKSTRR